MTTSVLVSQNPMQNCLNDIQHRMCWVQSKIFDLCSTDNKIYAFLIIGRILQAAALASFAVSVVSTFIIGPVSLIGAISAIGLGILGTYIAGNPQSLNDFLLVGRPFAPGQPVGLINSGSNCWLSSSLQILVNSPSFHPRLRQIPEFSRFLDSYAAARNDYQKVASIDVHILRQFLSRVTSGQISDGHVQVDAAQLFEYLFQGPNAIYQFEQQLNGGIPTLRHEPMIQVSLGDSPRPNWQELFNNYFDYRSDIGQRIQLFFRSPPDELLIQAKRFYQQINPANGALQQGKIVDLIDAPERLNVQDRFIRTRTSAQYVCDMFSIHYGSSQDVGHYATYIKIKDTDTWWYCSDAVVYEVPAQQALNAMKEGYIFHYSKIRPLA